MAELKYLAHINLNQNQLQNAAMQILSTDPSGFEGHVYYNSTDNELKFHNGSAYVALSTSTATGDITGVTLAGDSGTADDGTANVNLTIAGGNGITTSATGTTLTAAIDASQTTLTSITNTSLVVGRDADNQIKFGTDNNIIFRVGAGDGVTFKASGEIEATSLDISGDADIDGTLEADAITLGGVAIASVIAGTTVTTAGNANHVLITDNESTDEENQITFIEGAGGGGANRGLEADGDFTYNPSSGTVTATVFKGDIDANNGDFDGTLEADAITIGGTALNTVIAGVTVANATTAAVATTVTITDNENTNEENALVFTAGGDVDGGNLGLESDGNATYNPSSGTITATVFKGNIDAVDGDFDGTMEADAITIAGTNLLTGAVTFSGNTVFSGTPQFSTINVAEDIVHTGDTNNKISFGTDTQEFTTGGSVRLDVSDSGVRIGGSGARVTTIENNDSLGTSDTKLATQGNVKAYVDANTGTNQTTIGHINQSETAITSADINVTTDTFAFISANAQDPLVQLKNTTNDSNGARLQFVKDKGAAGADSDKIGTIQFTGDDAAQTQTDFGMIISSIGEADNTDEAGVMTFQVAASDGSTTGLRTGLIMTGHKTGQYVDVQLGNGSSSTVTIPGNLTVSGTTTTVNSTTVNLNDHNIVLDSGNSTSAVVDGAGITLEGGSGDDATFTYNTTGPQFEMKLGSSFEDLEVAKLTASSLDISGDVDVDGTLEADAITVNGSTLASVITGTTVTNANHLLITDNESTDEENELTFVEGAAAGGALRGLESSAKATFNPSNGKITATGFIGALTGNADTVTTNANLTGDVTSSGNATTIASAAVHHGMLNDDIISGQGALTSGLASTDELMISDAGTVKRMDVSVIQSYMQSNLTFTTNTNTVDMGDGFVIEDGDGTEVTITENKEIKFVEGGNIDINFTDTSTGSDGDPFDLTFAVPDASASTKGAVELATTAEALAGSDTSRAVTPAGLAARSFTATIGDGSDDDITIQHDLGTRNVIVQMYDASSYETVIAEVVRTDANNITINTNDDPSTIASNDVIVLITKVD